MRIGEVAAAVGTTPRTIRYYEEIGLMPGSAVREAGAHRHYSEDEVEQLREVLRLKGLLGLGLDELTDLVATQEARRTLREEFRSATTTRARRTRILEELDAIVGHQLELVDRRRAQLDQLDAELRERRERITARLEELSEGASSA